MEQSYTLTSVQFEGGDGRIPTAKVVMRKEDEGAEFSGISTGKHTADAAFRAVNRAISMPDALVKSVRFTIQTRTCNFRLFWDIEVLVDFAQEGVYGGRQSTPMDDSSDPFVLVAHTYVQVINRRLAYDGRPYHTLTPEEKCWYEERHGGPGS